MAEAYPKYVRFDVRVLVYSPTLDIGYSMSIGDQDEVKAHLRPIVLKKYTEQLCLQLADRHGVNDFRPMREEEVYTYLAMERDDKGKLSLKESPGVFGA